MGELLGFAPREIVATTTMVVSRVDIAAGEVFPDHRHIYHQLCWSPRGTYLMTVGDRAWNLSPLLALWVPAGVEHRFVSKDPLTLFDVKHQVRWCPVRLREPTLVAVSPLAGVLMSHLADEDLGRLERQRAEAVLYDNVRPVGAAARGIVLPGDPRARRVAHALLDDPGNARSLEDWATLVGSSRRTLVRVFREQTGLPFGEWRTTVRVQHAAALLAGGASSRRVATAVGYADPSSFIVGFRRVLGVTPGEYVSASRAADWPGLVELDRP